MRRLGFVAPLVLAACSFSGDADADRPGVRGEGSGGTRSYAVADFDSIDLRGADDVEVAVGSGFSVRATGDAEVLDRLRIERVGQTLRVDRLPESGWSWDGGNAKVLVTMPRIAAAHVSGSGDITVDQVEGARFEGAIAGSGGLTIDAMQVDAARLSVTGSGDVAARGSATRLDVSVTGSGNLKAGDLKARSAGVSVTGSGNVRAALDGEGDVRLAGSGDVDLGRSARCTVRATGSGTVRCGG